MRARSHRRKDVLVTGASGVIGQAIARRLARAGCRVHLAGRERKRLVPLQKELSSPGTSVPLYRIDLSDPAGCASAVRTFFRNAENPYGLVCCAGHLGPVGPFWTTPFEGWQRSFSENFLAHASMIHAFSKDVAARRRRPGAIVVLSGAGVGSQSDFSNVTSYSTSKAALVHLVEALEPELRPLQTTINAVAPGPVLSAMTRNTLRAGKKANAGFLKSARRCRETGGVSPDLAARLVEWLMGPGSRQVSGRLLSARFDQATVQEKRTTVARNSDWYRLRRIDYELFAPVRSS